MKRQSFRLGNVLRYYVLQKQRAEFDLQQASRIMRELDTEITKLGHDIAALAMLLQKDSGAELTTTGWLACYRNAENLDRRLNATRMRRQAQADVVAKLEGQRKRWAVAEETLLSLRRTIEDSNQAEAAKSNQIFLDETVMRRWLDADSNPTQDS